MSVGICGTGGSTGTDSFPLFKALAGGDPIGGDPGVGPGALLGLPTRVTLTGGDRSGVDAADAAPLADGCAPSLCCRPLGVTCRTALGGASTTIPRTRIALRDRATRSRACSSAVASRTTGCSCSSAAAPPETACSCSSSVEEPTPPVQDALFPPCGAPPPCSTSSPSESKLQRDNCWTRRRTGSLSPAPCLAWPPARLHSDKRRAATPAASPPAPPSPATAPAP